MSAPTELPIKTWQERVKGKLHERIAAALTDKELNMIGSDEMLSEIADLRAALSAAPTSPRPVAKPNNEEIEFDLADNPNWDLEIPLVMGAVERGALAHRVRAWGRQQFAAGKAAALAELHPQWLAEKERADRLQAAHNEASFDKLLAEPPEFVTKAVVGSARINPRGDEATVLGRQEIDVPLKCLHAWDCDAAGTNWSIWRCRHCGAERRR